MNLLIDPNIVLVSMFPDDLDGYRSASIHTLIYVTERAMRRDCLFYCNFAAEIYPSWKLMTRLGQPDGDVV